LRISINAWTAAALLCLLSVHADSLSATNETPMNAIELLTVFSGEDAKQYEPYFRYSDDSKIASVEIHAVGMETTIDRYTSDEEAWHEVNNILRITTVDGFEGVSGVDTYYQGGFSDEHFRALKDIAGDIVDLQSMDPVEVSSMLARERPALSDEVRASVDIALWDLAARKAGLPLHAMFGAKRNSIEAYASLPFYESLPEYVEAVNQYSKLGFTNFKFHVWGSIDKDLRLVKLVQQTFVGSPYRFAIDLESVYGIEDALELGRQMDEGLFHSFEAPINDELLAQYADLRGKLETHIIPAGYTVYSPEFIRQAIEIGAWDAGRFDATVVGGISEALELLIIANEADLPIDIQSWGHSLGQAANLHLMLANDRTPYFEAPMPKEAYEFGMTNGNLLERGRAVPPERPGLGIEVDWDRLPTADFYMSLK
jgi:L-alanine-DL-glutamate epimerase-like enolase superfamily enzyme